MLTGGGPRTAPEISFFDQRIIEIVKFENVLGFPIIEIKVGK